jgi:hypothetical protein
MTKNGSLINNLGVELRSVIIPPHLLLNTLIINSAISFLFFLGSLLLNLYDEQLLPVAAATILLWGLADSSFTNQLLFNKDQSIKEIKKYGSLERFLVIKNLLVIVLSVPVTIFYGLILVGITGKWTEILYGVALAFILIWGWLGISNAMSVSLPFDKKTIKNIVKNKLWFKYATYYVLPWILLPVYILILSIPFILLGWTRSDAANNHKLLTLIILFSCSLLIWVCGFIFVVKAATKKSSRLNKLLVT